MAMAVVIVYTAVLTVRNLFTVITVKYRMGHLREQKELFQARITEDSTMLERLKYDEYLEQYARERFHMQRPNEYIYIIEE
mgnify:CR=1 FL=1